MLKSTNIWTPNEKKITIVSAEKYFCLSSLPSKIILYYCTLFTSVIALSRSYNYTLLICLHFYDLSLLLGYEQITSYRSGHISDTLTFPHLRAPMYPEPQPDDLPPTNSFSYHPPSKGMYSLEQQKKWTYILNVLFLKSERKSVDLKAKVWVCKSCIYFLFV